MMEGAPMITSMTEAADVPAAMIAWAQEAVAGEIKRSLYGKYFNICSLDRVMSALTAFRHIADQPVRLREESAAYAGLRALHCVDYDQVRPGSVRQAMYSPKQFRRWRRDSGLGSDWIEPTSGSWPKVFVVVILSAIVGTLIFMGTRPEPGQCPLR
jgi:hypothetical protein